MTGSGKTQSSHTSSSTTSASAPAANPVRERRKPAAEKIVGTEKPPKSGNGSAILADDLAIAAMPSWTVRNRWIVFAIASGACAAFNGVFAKLTTNELSTNIAQAISGVLGLADFEGFVEVAVRASFFGLNLVFNGVMWTLFTQALAKGNSTTQVSIMNTSTNFVITALLGLAIFAESLPPLWWAGAALLVAGNVIIGRGKQEENGDAPTGTSADADGAVSGAMPYNDDDRCELGTANPSADATAFDEIEVEGEGGERVEKDDDEVDEDVALLGNLD
ncbi:hypothetical protein GGR54DRAFT_601814 [Hypoxylon sp. NC1633]|nr:hypothetical protein GGR54DRAFT_601814 [Hypoxylon sp. NC1633]